MPLTYPLVSCLKTPRFSIVVRYWESSPFLGTDMTVSESCCVMVMVVSGISVSRSIKSHIP